MLTASAHFKPYDTGDDQRNADDFPRREAVFEKDEPDSGNDCRPRSGPYGIGYTEFYFLQGEIEQCKGPAIEKEKSYRRQTIRKTVRKFH